MNTLLKNITKIAEEPVNINSLEDRMCVIGDSNVRDFWKTFFDDSEFHKMDVNAVGGRKTSDLKHLVRYAQRFKYVIVFFGTNNLSSGLFSRTRVTQLVGPVGRRAPKGARRLASWCPIKSDHKGS